MIAPFYAPLDTSKIDCEDMYEGVFIYPSKLMGLVNDMILN